MKQIRAVYVLLGVVWCAVVSAASHAQADVPPHTPDPVVVAINCGATSAYQGSSSTSYCGGPGTLFLADQYFSGGTATTVSTSVNGLAYFDAPLYRSFRSGPCTYTIPVPNGPYTVILAYCETMAGNAVGSRVFNVAIQGKTVLSNFDILANNRHPLTPAYMTFNATVSDGKLTIAQSDGPAGTPTISAIIVRKPPKVPTKIACGEYQLFYLVNGEILAAGSNRCDEGGYPMGVGNCYFPSRPIAKTEGVTFTDAACLGYASIALDSTGCVWTWGGNGFGEQGNGTITGPSASEFYYTPRRLLTDISGRPFNNIKQITGGFSFAAALKNDSTVWVWGSCKGAAQCGDTGIIGNGDLTEQVIVRPRQVPVFTLPGVTITQISAGIGTIMALDSTGAVWSWGGSGYGPVFDRGTMITIDKNYAIPTKLGGALVGKKIISITNGAGAVYAIDSDHNLYCWGMYGNKMCRGTSTQSQPIPYPIAMNYTKLAGLSGHVKQVATSGNVTHVLLDDGSVWGWGSDCCGEVGDGNMQWSLSTSGTPPALDHASCMVIQPVKILSDVADIYAVAQSGAHFAVKTDGSIWSWGFNKTTYLGNGVGGYPVDVATHADYFDQPTPTQVCPY